tara:strand:+ start:4417 stop:5520 length:1104 start_codon:yes stop_codon:yes gene_type:complete
MSEQANVVRGVNDLLALIEAPEGFDPESIRFEGWPVVDIKIYGDKYHGDLTPEMAKALYELSQSLKRAYAVYKYGSPNLNAFKAQDHELFSGLTFTVGEGCTGIGAKISEAFQSISLDIIKEAVKNMDSKDIARVLIVLGVFTVGTFAAYKGYGLHTEAKMEQARLDAQKETQQITADANTNLLQENRELVKTILLEMPEETRHSVVGYGEQVNEGYRQVVRSASDADRIEFGGNHLGREEIDDIATKNAITTETLPVTDEPAIIEGITKNIAKGTISVRVATDRFPGRSITLQFFMGGLATDADQRLYQALEHSMSKRAVITYTATINAETGDFDRGTLTHVGDLVSYRVAPRTQSDDGLDVASSE